MGMYDDQSSPEDRKTFEETMRLWDKDDRNKGVNKMTAELIKQGTIDYEDVTVAQTLRATVARDTTPSEYWIFAQYCKTTGLNPLKNEIWCIKTRDRMQLMTGINGYLAIANRHPMFDGIQTVINEQDGKVISATCRVWRKDRKYAHECTAYMSEFYKPGYNGKKSTWDLMPRKMLEKVAKCHTLREAFPQEMNGLYTEDEMPAEYASPKIEPVSDLLRFAEYAVQKVETGSELVKPKVNITLDELYVYKIPNPTDKQKAFFAEHGIVPKGDFYELSQDLGPKAEKYLVSWDEYQEYLGNL